MSDTISALNQFFRNKLPLLEESYEWKIPNIEGFSQSGKTGYTYNVELKKYFSKK